MLLRLLWRARAEPAYAEQVDQRLGLFPVVAAAPTIWLHAVSVGETRAAEPLVRALKARWPHARILLTQTTATGRATARALFDKHVVLAWLPWDLPWTQRAFFKRWKPAIGILMETELWPNLVAEGARAHVPISLINARLSPRSARGYARLSALVHPMLDNLSVIAAQTQADAHRLKALGARNVAVTGNLKFDVAFPDGQLAQSTRWRTSIGSRRVVLLASTREGEEAILLPALLARLPPDVLIALVPRHPQRFDEVARLADRHGIRFARRSSAPPPDAAIQLWLGDSMGEMFAWYALADVAVIGGSWLPLGGQNLIEACAVGCPVVVGPHTFNFAQATDDAVAAGAALRATDAQDMASAVAALLDDDKKRQAMSEAGLAFAEAHRGATARCMALIEPLLRGRIEGAAGNHQ